MSFAPRARYGPSARQASTTGAACSGRASESQRARTTPAATGVRALTRSRSAYVPSNGLSRVLVGRDSTGRRHGLPASSRRHPAMAQHVAPAVKKTALHARHVALGARMVPFAGFDMPVEYSGIGDEHLAVRTGAGLFDVSHMGQIEVAGADALPAVQRITSNDAGKLKIGQAQYLGSDDARRRVRGRPARLPAVLRSLPARGERLERREGLRVDSRADRRRRRCRGGGQQRPVRAHRGTGACRA